MSFSVLNTARPFRHQIETRFSLRESGEVLLLPFRLVATALQWRPGRRR